METTHRRPNLMILDSSSRCTVILASMHSAHWPSLLGIFDKSTADRGRLLIITRLPIIVLLVKDCRHAHLLLPDALAHDEGHPRRHDTQVHAVSGELLLHIHRQIQSLHDTVQPIRVSEAHDLEVLLRSRQQPRVIIGQNDEVPVGEQSWHVRASS